MNPKAYLARFVAFGLLFAVLLIGFNYLVDPYAIFGAKRIPGFNQYKIDINNFTRLSKRYQPGLGQYSALVVGNSRVEMGINPAHRCFRNRQWQVYNLGLPGADVATQLEYALNVMYQQPIEHVLLSVDFTDFIARSPRAGTRPPALQRGKSRLRYLPTGALNPGYLLVLAEDYYSSLFTLDAFVSSVTTVARQSPHAADRDDAGFNPARDFANAVRVKGVGAIFAQKMDELLGKYSTRWQLREADGRSGGPFEDIAGFLAVAAQRGVEVQIFSSPFHEHFWRLMREHGLMPLYREWLEMLEDIVSRRTVGAVSLWDFSGDSAFIHEPVPEVGARGGPLQWFWEPVHYRETLGSLMVDAMMSDSCNTDIEIGRKIH